MTGSLEAITDTEGFLRSLSDWNESVAESIAAKAGITLSDDHWLVLNLVRAYYEDHGIFPANRVLLAKLRENHGDEKGSSIFLMQLFTGKPRRYIAMISGLPKPTNCD